MTNVIPHLSSTVANKLWELFSESNLNTVYVKIFESGNGSNKTRIVIILESVIIDACFLCLYEFIKDL
ncbi:hypothetical protein MHYMCMPSP_00494 [Hyalomma marginatum]|nr:hypothetical protein MHYMCMPSP_00494 [Hyalomma marginatum]